MAVTPVVIASTSNDPANDELRIYDDTTTYGAPSDDRVDFAVYLSVLKKEPSGTDTIVAVANDDTTADTVASWSVAITEDGWYQAQLVLIPVWDSAATYSINQLIWFTDALYRVVTATAAAESPVTHSAKYATFASTDANIYDVAINTSNYSIEGIVYTDQLDDLVTYRGDTAYKDIWQAASSYCADYSNVPERLYKLTAYLEGAKIAFARNRFAEADKKMDVVADLAAGKDCVGC